MKYPKDKSKESTSPLLRLKLYVELLALSRKLAGQDKVF